VGAVAVRDKRIILTGLNGTPPGDDNCCEDETLFLDTEQGWIKGIVTKDSVSHAEENLITFAAHNGIPLEGCGMFITHAPCIHCAKLIRNSGFDYVVYENEYRSVDGLNYLKHHIDVKKFSEIEYDT